MGRCLRTRVLDADERHVARQPVRVRRRRRRRSDREQRVRPQVRGDARAPLRRHPLCRARGRPLPPPRRGSYAFRLVVASAAALVSRPALGGDRERPRVIMAGDRRRWSQRRRSVLIRRFGCERRCSGAGDGARPRARRRLPSARPRPRASRSCRSRTLRGRRRERSGEWAAERRVDASDGAVARGSRYHRGRAACSSWSRYVALMIAPRIAAPSAPPTMRSAWRTPDETPLLSCETAPRPCRSLSQHETEAEPGESDPCQRLRLTRRDDGRRTEREALPRAPRTRARR